MSDLSKQSGSEDGDNSRLTTNVQADNAHFGVTNVYVNQPKPKRVKTYDVEELDRKLKEVTRKHAKVVIGTQKPKPEPVDLGLINERIPSREEFGRCCRQPHVREGFFRVEGLFEAAMRNARDKCHVYCSTPEAEEQFVTRHGHIIGIVGMAGIGKSTLGKQHLKHILEFLLATSDDAYVFHVSLRDFDPKRPLNLLRFLLKSCRIAWRHSAKSDAALLRRIAASRNVYITMDSLDESRFSKLEEDAAPLDLLDEALPEVIFKNLASGEMLPLAHKMLISRPGAYHLLHPHLKALLTVRVIGLVEESRDLLFERMYPERHGEIVESLKANPNAESLCFIPAFAKLVASYVLDRESTQGVFTIADIFAECVSSCRRSTRFTRKEKKVLPNLARLALDGISKEAFVFNKRYLKSFQLDGKSLESFLSLQVNSCDDVHLKIIEGEREYYFSHASWQEFFAAVCLWYLTSDEEFTNILQDCHSTKWEMVMVFLYGLANPVVHRKLGFLSSIESIPEAKWNFLIQHCKTLALHHSRLAETVLPVPVNAIYEADSQIQWHAIQKRPSDAQLIQVCSFAHESKSEELAKIVRELLPEVIRLSGTVAPSEVASLCHVLVARQLPVVINVGAYMEPAMIVANGLEVLLDVLLKKATQHKIPKLHIINAKLTTGMATMTAQLVSGVDELSLQMCENYSAAIYPVLESLSSRNLRMSMLDLSLNKMDDHSIELLCKGLGKIGRLELHSCEISSQQTERMSQSIRSLHEPLKLLNLGGNQFGIEGLNHFNSCLENIEVLKVNNCEIKGHQLGPFAAAVSQLSKPMIWLGLGLNEIGLDGVQHLSTCAHNIQMLWLYRAEIDGHGVKLLTEKLQEPQHPTMRRLSLGGNNIGSLGVLSLAACLEKIEILEIENCGLTPNDVVALAARLELLKQRIKLLNLSCNEIGDEGMRRLASCLPQVEILWLDCCDVNQARLEHLTEAVAKLESPMKALNINSNPIDDIGLALLSTCHHKIGTLGISNCKFNPDCLSGYPEMKYPRVVAQSAEKRCDSMHNIPTWDVAHSTPQVDAALGIRQETPIDQPSTSGLS